MKLYLDVCVRVCSSKTQLTTNPFGIGYIIVRYTIPKKIPILYSRNFFGAEYRFEFTPVCFQVKIATMEFWFLEKNDQFKIIYSFFPLKYF